MLQLWSAHEKKYLTNILAAGISLGNCSVEGSDPEKAKKSVMRRLRRKRWSRRLLWILPVLLVAVFLFDYFANIPRERDAGAYWYHERAFVGLGTVLKMTALKLFASHEDLKNSQLEVAEIYIRGDRYDRLQAALPNTDVREEKAEIKLGKETFSGRVRFRGDSMNHWAFPNKSWRIELKQDDYYKGMQSINLNVPRVESQMANWLGYQMTGRMGSLITPYSDNVHFRLNRKYDGVRLLLEQPNQDSLVRRGLPAGKIFVGDIETEQIYGGVALKQLYEDPTAWSVRGPSEEPNSKEIEELTALLRSETPPVEFSEKLAGLVDLEAVAKYMALLEIVGSVHIDDVHNGKFYFHSHLGRFIPIVWDTVAYMWGDLAAVDIGANLLFRRIIENPLLREEKDSALWNAVQSALQEQDVLRLVNQEADRMKRDIYAFPFKLHASDEGIQHISNGEYEEALARLRTAIHARQERVVSHLSKSLLSYSFIPNGEREGEYFLDIQLSSAAGFLLKEISFEFDGKEESSRVTLHRLSDGADSGVSASSSTENGVTTYSLQVGDPLYSGRTFKDPLYAEIVPRTYRYLVRGLPAYAKPRVTVLGENTVSGEPVSARAVESPLRGEPVGESGWWLDGARRGRIYKLSGSTVLQKTLRVGPSDSIRVVAGTQLSLGPRVSIFVDGGSIYLEGTADSPITVQGTNPSHPWGTIALRNVKEGVIRHVRISGGTFDTLGHVRYEGLVAVHGGSVSAEHLQGDGNYLSVKSGELKLSSSEIHSPFPFGVKVENGSYFENGVKHVTAGREHSDRLFDVTAEGTPPREEREFKYTIRLSNKAPLDPVELSHVIHQALQKNIEDESRWLAPFEFGGKYLLDAQSEGFLFRDIYFDTEDEWAYENSISYRYRNRYSSRKNYKRHLKQYQRPEFWPHRLEFQAKFDREELGDGFSTVKEARFEFRNASRPFGESFQAPPPPWAEDEFLTYFETGLFQGIPTTPAKLLYQKYFGSEKRRSLAFEPAVVLLTDRHRVHFHLPTPYGSGPNPDQAFIVSLDSSEIFRAAPYLEYLSEVRRGTHDGGKPKAVGELLEIEVEFERNVSDVLDRQILEEKSESRREVLLAHREKFLHDQKTIMAVIAQALAELDLEVLPASKSKYVQAMEALKRAGSSR
ncbi:MAG: CotH kinase family protein [Bdellovibrionales bacterium]|nr:CotH kinase family protein [Bdellovibrionales bacterium]